MTLILALSLTHLMCDSHSNTKITLYELCEVSYSPHIIQGHYIIIHTCIKNRCCCEISLMIIWCLAHFDRFQTQFSSQEAKYLSILSENNEDCIGKLQ